MSTGKEPKNKKKANEVLSWQQKKEIADRDEEAVRKDVEEISSWVFLLLLYSGALISNYRPDLFLSFAWYVTSYNYDIFRNFETKAFAIERKKN